MHQDLVSRDDRRAGFYRLLCLMWILTCCLDRPLGALSACLSFFKLVSGAVVGDLGRYSGYFLGAGNFACPLD